MVDESKRVAEDIHWREDSDHAPAFEFRVEVKSGAGYPLQVNGRFNWSTGTLSYTLIHRTTGRIYGLDIGADHHNPTYERVGELHKHHWTDPFADKLAYVPRDITATQDDSVVVWHQFCAEAKITHGGTLDKPPAAQEELPL